ncbi:translocation/assembly module TamB domain-containing protein [Phreatobacter sp.]|uniref:translocation/assembly module TamB domain-containing protein n=1 Tax=Phreatobacter sp. TaxID=1966341 RepID=UPI0025DA32F5|nr:translocation/assembly module TamB domain-containing protein [Phreatobacter sp.]
MLTRARTLAGLTILLLLAVAAVMLTAGRPHAQEDQGVLAGFISRTLSSPGSTVAIGAVEGPLSSDAMIRDVTIADGQGVYLKIDTIRLVWRRVALLSRRLEVQNLEIGTVELLRRPVADPNAQPAADGSLLPELPLKVEISRFTVREFRLGEPVLGVAAHFTASGNASLGPPAEGLNAVLEVRRLDARGVAALKLTYVPASQQLDLSLQHDEPAGGIAARLANLPGLPPVKLDVTGAGHLDDWRGRVAFDAGPDINARGDAVVTRDDQIRRLGLTLDARIESLLPPAVSAVFAGDTKLQGRIVFGDDGGYAIETFRLASQLAELTAQGYLTARNELNVTARARALPNTEGATARGGARIDRLVFDATAMGALNAPRVEGKLDLKGLESPTASVASLAAMLSAEPESPGSPRYRIIMDGEADGLVLPDRGISEAIGNRAVLTLRAIVDEEAVTEVSAFTVTSPHVRLAFTGRTGAKVLDGQIQADILRLAAFSRLAGRPLAGQGYVAATLSGDPSAGLTRALLNGRATGLALGDPLADRLVGREATLAGTIIRRREVMTLEGVSLAGRHVTAGLDGTLGDGRIALHAALTLPDLSQVDRQLAGAARADARVTGDMVDPSVALTLTAPSLRAMNRPVHDLTLVVDARRLGSAPSFAVTAGGDVDGKPLTVDLLAREVGSAWVLDRLNARLGSVSADGQGRLGQGRLGEDRLVAGRLAVTAGNLDDISPLVLTRLAGSLRVTVTADASGGRQSISVTGDGQRLAFGAASLNILRADLRAEDLFGRPRLDGEATLDRLVAGGETVERIALKAEGSPEATALSLAARARGFALASAGRLVPGTPNRLDLASFTATRQGARIALVRPATLTFEGAQVRTERLVVALQGGEIEMSGAFGTDVDATVAARRVPLAAVDILMPGTGLRGTLDASATLRGPAAAPRGPFEATVRGFSAPATRDAGLPGLDLTARGEARGERASLDARITGGRTIAISLAGSLPLTPAGALDVTVRGTLDAALANAQIAGSGQRVTGRLAIDGALRGTAGRPDIQGSATLSGGSFSDPLNGIAFTVVEGRLTGRGTEMVVERLTGRAKNGGTVQVSGRIDADPLRGFPADLRIAARNAELISSDVVQLTASLALAVTGPLATAPRLAGCIDVATIEVRVPDRLPSTSEPLRDARHVGAPPQTRARLAQIARQRKAATRRGTAPFNATLDVVLDAPGRVFVRGRGIDAELGGQLRLAGTTRDVSANGAFEMRRGRLSLLTQRLDFTRGRLTFGGGDLIPDLDFVAETRATDITASIGITGRATEPEFTLSSTPSLPQDEVLSRLLFQRAAAGLSPFQAIQLAQAVAILSGSRGSDAFEATRRALGVDNLDVTTGASGPAVGVSRAINERVRIGVRTGARPENSTVGVDIDLTRRIRIQTEIGADGRAAAGIGAEIEY